MRTSMTLAWTVAFLGLAACLAACDAKKASTASGAPPAESTAAPSALASASAVPPPPDAQAPAPAVGMRDRMAHCPSAVDGAATRIQDLPDGVELTITASDAAKSAEIRARAKALAEAVKNPAMQSKHNGGGGGGGAFGRCPVVVKNTEVSMVDIDQGTRVTVKPKDPKELDWLKRETREREEAIAAQVAQVDAGAGANRMEHCPSAVEGAKTVVKATKDGAQLTITGATADAQRAIRDRAKHVVDVMKHDGGAIAHTGEGTGGHSLGRCPEVIEGASVSARDIASGSEIAIKAKSAGDVEHVQREVKQRAERFVAPAASAPPR